MESAPAQRGSVSGKCPPMSPRAAAPRSASITAWARAGSHNVSRGTEDTVYLPSAALHPLENNLTFLEVVVFDEEYVLLVELQSVVADCLQETSLALALGQTQIVPVAVAQNQCKIPFSGVDQVLGCHVGSMIVVHDNLNGSVGNLVYDDHGHVVVVVQFHYFR